jgi:hypothetical protein
LLLATLLVVLGPTFAQEGGQKPADAMEKAAREKAAAPEKTASKPELPFQIQLLETHIRFEVNGDSRKEVHTLVKINNILGAHQFARLTFDYNRAFQQVEIPLVRISHANGGTSELLPSAVVDAPNPAVEKFPAYQDVRVKSVRILGLEEGDTIEYRVITTTTKHPLAPDFWFEHTFDRSGQVLEEHYELNVPQTLLLNALQASASGPLSAPNPPLTERNQLHMYVSPETPATNRAVGDDLRYARYISSWKIKGLQPWKEQTASNASDVLPPDVVITTFSSWAALSTRLSLCMSPNGADAEAIQKKEKDLLAGAGKRNPLESIYDFVSQEITTVDLPLESSGYRARAPEEILASGYASPLDKIVLLGALLHELKNSFDPLLVPITTSAPQQLPRPNLFGSVLLRAVYGDHRYILEPDLGVAPFGAVRGDIRGKSVLAVDEIMADWNDTLWTKVPNELPFPSSQNVAVNATLVSDGTLSAKVKYTLRGDNELLLRVAFHQTAKEKWKDVAGLLALSDGFRGQVTSADVSDPMATKDPFTVEYEITQAKFVDWSKKPVRIPALLPQIGLPDPPARQAAGEAVHTIELGTPLDVDTQMTLKLPAGTVVQAPAGTSVERDYAKFSSKYSTAENTLTASRRVNFLMREIPGDRAMDYTAFVHAVQSDQAQMITLVREAVAAQDAKAGKSPTKQ